MKKQNEKNIEKDLGIEVITDAQMVAVSGGSLTKVVPWLICRVHKYIKAD